MTWFGRSNIDGRKSRGGILFPLNNGGQHPVWLVVEWDQRLDAAGSWRWQFIFKDVAAREAELSFLVGRVALAGR